VRPWVLIALGWLLAHMGFCPWSLLAFLLFIELLTMDP